MASGGKGKLAYFEPWGDVVMFYDSFNENSSLFELGEVVSGQDDIEKLSRDNHDFSIRYIKIYYNIVKRNKNEKDNIIILTFMISTLCMTSCSAAEPSTNSGTGFVLTMQIGRQ